jgi:hypothetical protein
MKAMQDTVRAVISYSQILPAQNLVTRPVPESRARDLVARPAVQVPRVQSIAATVQALEEESESE